MTTALEVRAGPTLGVWIHDRARFSDLPRSQRADKRRQGYPEQCECQLSLAPALRLCWGTASPRRCLIRREDGRQPTSLGLREIVDGYWPSARCLIGGFRSGCAPQPPGTMSNRQGGPTSSQRAIPFISSRTGLQSLGFFGRVSTTPRASTLLVFLAAVSKLVYLLITVFSLGQRSYVTCSHVYRSRNSTDSLWRH